MPQQYPLLQQQQQQQQQQPYLTEPYIPNNNTVTSNMFPTPRQSVYNDYPSYPATQPQILSQPSNNNTPNNNNNDFQRFYGPVSLSIGKLFLFSFVIFNIHY
jgi:hypothetical protein